MRQELRLMEQRLLLFCLLKSVWGFFTLSFFNELYYVREESVFSNFCCFNIQNSILVYCCSDNIITFCFINRQTFSSNHRLVNTTLSFYNNSICRDFSPGLTIKTSPIFISEMSTSISLLLRVKF